MSMKDTFKQMVEEIFSKIGKASAKKIIANISDNNVEFDTIKNSRGSGRAPEPFPFWKEVMDAAIERGFKVGRIETTWANGKSATHPYVYE